MLTLLSRRRARKSTGQHADVDPDVLLRALEGIREKSATGRLTLRTDTGRQGHLYTFEGELYAVELEGYQPPVDQRLRAGALIDPASLMALTAEEPTSSPAHRGRMAATRGWVSVEQLGSIHHEFVLAALGAALEARVSMTSFTEGLATGEVCAFPTPVEVLVEAVTIRRARMCEDWGRVGGSPFAEDCILRCLGSELPEDCQLPEFLTLFQAIDGEKSLGQVAFESGFTLAEAVHLVSALVVRGLVVPHGTTGSTATELLVPESFPRLAGAPDNDASDVDSDPESTHPELTDAEPEPLEMGGDLDGREAEDADQGRTHSVDVAFVEALREELVRAELHVQSLRAQLDRIATMPADA